LTINLQVYYKPAYFENQPYKIAKLGYVTFSQSLLT